MPKLSDYKKTKALYIDRLFINIGHANKQVKPLLEEYNEVIRLREIHTLATKRAQYPFDPLTPEQTDLLKQYPLGQRGDKDYQLLLDYQINDKKLEEIKSIRKNIAETLPKLRAEPPLSFSKIISSAISKIPLSSLVGGVVLAIIGFIFIPSIMTILIPCLLTAALCITAGISLSQKNQYEKRQKLKTRDSQLEKEEQELIKELGSLNPTAPLHPEQPPVMGAVVKEGTAFFTPVLETVGSSSSNNHSQPHFEGIPPIMGALHSP